MDSITSHILKLGIVLLACITYTSCIKQSSENCTPTYRAIVTVEDKNYANISSIPGLSPKDEQQAFKQYVPNLSYRLLDAVTGEQVDGRSDMAISHNNTTHLLDFNSIQPGQYILNVYGNTSQLTDKKNNVNVYHLHPSGQEGDDIYIFHDSIRFTPESPTTTVPLIRTKGALLVQIENLPDSVAKIEEFIQNVYTDVNENAVYSDQTSVTKDFTSNLHPTPTLFTILAPTVVNKQSVLRLALYTEGANTPYMFIPDIPLIIKRNEITAFKFNFKLEGGVEVWISANGVWTKSHDLDLTLDE